MNNRTRNFLRIFGIFFVAVSIPGLLILNGVQSARYRELQKSIIELEKKQEFLIEENKKMITDIGVLSGSDRIESIAENELGMRKAESDEIVRVNLGAGK